MSIFSKFLDNSKERELKKSMAKIHNEVEREYKPIGEVGRAIVQASMNCREAVKELIKMPTEEEKQEREIFIFYEFIYFYMHLTMRQAFGVLSEEQIKKIQDFLGPVIASVAIDSYFAHWPEDIKEKMTGEFYEKLNDAEMEYAACTQSETSAEGEERIKEKFRALFLKLCSNVADLASNEESNLTLLIPVMEVASKEWAKMHLGKLISAIKESSSL